MSANWRQTLYEDFDPRNHVTGILWRGLNVDDGKYLWYDNTLSCWVITQNTIGFIVRVADSDEITGDNSSEADGYWYTFNGHRYWKLPGGYYLWYSSEYSAWVISGKLGTCTDEIWFDNTYYLAPYLTSIENQSEGNNIGSTDFEVEEKSKGNTAVIRHYEVNVTDMVWTPLASPSPDPEGDYEEPGIWTVEWETTLDYDGKDFTVELYNYHYKGNEWWGPSGGLEGTYQARGLNRGYAENEYLGIPKTIAFTYSGYRRNTTTGEAPAGIYQEFIRELNGSIIVPDNSWSREVGLPRWIDGSGNNYVQSLKQDTNSEYSYGEIYYDGSKWVIGERNNISGWWEGVEPDRSSNVTFEAKKLDGEGNVVNDPDTNDIIVSYDQLVIGDNYINEDTDQTVLAAQVGMWL